LLGAVSHLDSALLAHEGAIEEPLAFLLQRPWYFV